MLIGARRNHVRPPLGGPLEFGHSPSTRRAMFIDARRNQVALRHKGHVSL
jgi:hypothetical protein